MHKTIEVSMVRDMAYEFQVHCTINSWEFHHVTFSMLYTMNSEGSTEFMNSEGSTEE